MTAWGVGAVHAAAGAEKGKFFIDRKGAFK
jgi:hypothetical protein